MRIALRRNIFSEVKIIFQNRILNVIITNGILQDLANEIKATPGRILDAAVLKAEETAADIAKIPQIAVSKVSNAYETKKQEISDTIDKNVQSVKKAVDSIIPSEKAI